MTKRNASNNQANLFEQAQTQRVKSSTPLSHQARPEKLEQFQGITQLQNKYPFLKREITPSLILWGPPGTGKTTLAQLLADRSGKEFYRFNAVLSGVPELRKLIERANEMRQMFHKECIIFIDEIHRFSRSQQDALLPYVEAGDFQLIGATTENPKTSVNRALLSRVQIVELERLSMEQIQEMLTLTKQRFDLDVTNEAITLISKVCGGDARISLNALDLVSQQKQSMSLEDLERLVVENARQYDKSQDRHYDVISAFIKSLRGSDPNAAILWLAVMLDGGEDPVFIARRLVIFASEDIGNADPTALNLALAGLEAVKNIGMPEARINLAQVTTYLASTVKSNASYVAINEALEFVRQHPTLEVPRHLRNLDDQISNYKYPHSFQNHFVKQDYGPGRIPQFYRPSDEGREKNIKARLSELWN